MVSTQVVGNQHARGGLLVTLHAGFGILSDRCVVEVEFIHFFRLHHGHIHPGFVRKLLLGIGVTESTGIIRFVDLHLVAGRADIMVRHSGFPLGTDRMAISAGNPLVHHVSLVCELQEPGGVGRLGGFEDGGSLDQSRTDTMLGRRWNSFLDHSRQLTACQPHHHGSKHHQAPVKGEPPWEN